MQEPVLLGARRMRTATLAHFRSAVVSASGARAYGGGHFRLFG